MGVLMLLLLANEAERLKVLGLSLKFALLSLCFLCFCRGHGPVFTGSIGLPVFLLSMGVAAAADPAGAWNPRLHTGAVRARRRQILVPLVSWCSGS